MYTKFRDAETDAVIGYATEELFNDCAETANGVARGALVDATYEGLQVYGRAAVADEGVEGYCERTR
jgi:hypothetical protein